MDRVCASAEAASAALQAAGGKALVEGVADGGLPPPSSCAVVSLLARPGGGFGKKAAAEFGRSLAMAASVASEHELEVRNGHVTAM